MKLAQLPSSDLSYKSPLTVQLQQDARMAKVCDLPSGTMDMCPCAVTAVTAVTLSYPKCPVSHFPFGASCGVQTCQKNFLFE